MASLLQIKDLTIEYHTDAGVVQALNHVDLKISEGATVGLVGETGAGKTTLSKGIMGLIRTPPGKIVSGEILYDGQNLLTASDARMRSVRGNQISMIFQDPMTSLNPVMTVGAQIAEAIQNHEKSSAAAAEKRAKAMLQLVGIDAGRSNDYPHQFSGGMKQRVVIAMALACSPRILIADEPTTALDVTIQAQVLELMQDLKREFRTATLLVTHDLGVVAQTCEMVAIIYAGRIVEYGTVQDVFKRMKHPYTIGLFNSMPKINTSQRRLQPIRGLMPDPMNLPAGCSFYERCPQAMDCCQRECPPAYPISGVHYARCFLARGDKSDE